MTRLCECGCGEPAPVAKANNKKRGAVKGQPLSFVSGHQNRGRRWSDVHRSRFQKATKGHYVSPETRQKISESHKRNGVRPSKEAAAKGNRRPKGPLNSSWKGGISITNGRRCIYLPEHHRSHRNGYVYEHILIAEEVLGRSLIDGEVVHHLDGDVSNNTPENLEVMPSQSEHMKLHKLQGDLR